MLPTWLHCESLGWHAVEQSGVSPLHTRKQLLHPLTTLHLPEASSVPHTSAEIPQLLPLRGCKEAPPSPHT